MMVRHAGGCTVDQIRSETGACMDQVSQNRKVDLRPVFLLSHEVYIISNQRLSSSLKCDTDTQINVGTHLTLLLVKILLE